MSRWKYDVFLSHHSDDKPDVARLADVLQRQGVKPWLDTWNLVVGDPWQPELEKALLESRTCAVFVGTHGLGPWQNQEMRWAIRRPCRAAEPDLHDGPYRGLRFFDVQHAGLFFGRDEVVDWLLSSLRGTQSKDASCRKHFIAKRLNTR